ncbi:hypothetical protein P175DRAFT_0531905 [Aspergillus ochraceoroseus IBT 24754]|uniref:Uncharacterized protein n=1 Tax=Aspergillus ochraceoroseus IBT 24754 TaxID=1392256 RepID=A0A2T5LWA1_9EURO|nr:uncharacterized protein P175DRAFT_0531905 [Aspergillus ochraceoroseus IBT 24754]PTU20565.1 hypothetical protein P175DRAFT_0531905 [Aspergillus ochraceoroseus IBT 24754]
MLDTTGTADCEQTLKMFPEDDLRAEINRPVSGVPYVFTGHADWAAGTLAVGFQTLV